jgi:hypothetical protein
MIAQQALQRSLRLAILPELAFRTGQKQKSLVGVRPSGIFVQRGCQGRCRRRVAPRVELGGANQELCLGLLRRGR